MNKANNMLAEFEEKQYEQHLNNALLRDKRLLFPPGQVLENYLGFDAALFTVHPKFWRHFPWLYEEHFWFWRRPPNGTRLPKELWKKIEYLIEDLPKFKFNTFIQHKRPEYMTVSRAAEWASWNAPYYRYKLISHQQSALSRLEKIIANKGVVVYACPAFHTLQELWATVKQDSIIDKSNFCQAGKLDNHQVYTFQKAGNYGIAHSEQEKVESYDILRGLGGLSQSEPSQSNKEHLAKLAKTIDSVMTEENKQPSKIYKDVVKYLVGESKEVEIVNISAKIYAFRFIMNTDILIGY